MKNQVLWGQAFRPAAGLPPRAIYLFSLLALAPSYAQPTPPSPTPDKPASVEGSVNNAVTGEPLVRATVNFRTYGADGKAYGALTNAEGKFSITGMVSGTYNATATRVGFVTSAAGVTQRNEQFKLGAGDKRTEIKLKLIPMGSIAGRVVDPDGEPMEGIDVAAILNSRPIVSATTDDKGTFRMMGVAPGKYRVRARPQSLPFSVEIRTDGTEEIHYARTFYPNAPDEASAARVEVAAGVETPGIDIHPRRTRLIRLRGVVRGMPPDAKGINVQLQENNGMFIKNAQAKPDGTFEMWHVDAGSYKLIAMRFESGRSTLQSAKVDVEIGDSNVDNVELRMTAAADLQGRVEYDDDQAKPSEDQQQPSGAPKTKAPPRIVYLRSSGLYGTFKSAPLGPDGSFTLTDVAPDRYSVTLSWNGGYVKSTLLSQKLSDGPLVDLQNVAEGQSLSIRISSATAELSGVVRDDNGPAAGARVLLTLDDPNITFNFHSASTDANGAYTIKGIAPGKYRVVPMRAENAMHAENAIPVTQGRLSEDYLDISEVVDFVPKDKLTRDLKMRLAGSK